MALEDCIRAIRDAAEGDISDDEALELMDLVRQRRDRLRQDRIDLGEAELLTEAARQIGQEAEMAARIEARNAKLNLVKRLERRQFYGSAPRPELGLQAKLTGTNTPFAGSRRSVEAQGNALVADWAGGVTVELERAGLFRMVRSGQADRAIARELFELNRTEGGRPGISGDAAALEAAKILQKYQRIAVDAQNRAGAWIGSYDGYITRTAHDPDLIRRAGFEEWRRAIGEALDLDRTLEAVDDVEGFFRSVYRGLVTGLHLTPDGLTGMKDPAFKGPGNLAKRLSQSRTLHFRDADTWMGYFERFGGKSLIQQHLDQLRQAGRHTALMREFGTNPRADFEADLQWLKESHRDDIATLDRLRRAEHGLRLQFGELDGASQMPENRQLARIGQGARHLQAQAKLGGVLLSSLADIPMKAAELRYQGINLFEAYGDGFVSFIRGRGQGQQREVADLLRAGLDGMLGDMVGRFDAPDTIPGTLSKITNVFFKWTGLTRWTDSQKAGAEVLMARHLGRMSGRSWNGLPEETRRILAAFDIRPQEWEALRRQDLTVEGQMRQPDDELGPAHSEPGTAGEPTEPDAPASEDFTVPGAPRPAWPDDFPDVIAHSGSTRKLTSHPRWADAKKGDLTAAADVVDDLVDLAKVREITAALKGRKPIVVPVFSGEGPGRNALPMMYAARLADDLGLDVAADIVQANRSFRTGSTASHRVATRTAFDGPVVAGQDYLIVDDAVTQGGTLADLRAYIESKGGRVVLASTLAAAQNSGRLAVRPETIAALRHKMPDLEPWWRERYGYDYSGLTESEARWLLNFGSADRARARVSAARAAADAGPGAAAGGRTEGGPHREDGGLGAEPPTGGDRYLTPSAARLLPDETVDDLIGDRIAAAREALADRSERAVAAGEREDAWIEGRRQRLSELMESARARLERNAGRRGRKADVSEALLRDRIDLLQQRVAAAEAETDVLGAVRGLRTQDEVRAYLDAVEGGELAHRTADRTDRAVERLAQDVLRRGEGLGERRRGIQQRIRELEARIAEGQRTAGEANDAEAADFVERFQAMGDELTAFTERMRERQAARLQAVADAEGRMPALLERLRAEYRDDLALKLAAYFKDRGDFAVIQPGARERAIVNRGLRPGTIEGEAIRLIMQFKTFPVAMITRTLGRELYGQARPAAIAGILHVVGSATVFGYLAMVAKDLAKGRNPRDPRDPATWAAAFVQGGGAGIFGDFLMGQTNRFGGGLLDTLAGPTLGSLRDLKDLYDRARSGDQVAAPALRFALSNTPFVNLFYTRIALDYLFLYQVQEALNPGFLRRMERRMAKDSNQTFMFPPSQAIPAGGGGRLFEGVRGQ